MNGSIMTGIEVQEGVRTMPKWRAASHISDTTPCLFRLPPWKNVDRSTTVIDSTWEWHHPINYSWDKLFQSAWAILSYMAECRILGHMACCIACFSPLIGIFPLNFCARASYSAVFSTAFANFSQDTSCAFRCHQSRTSILQRRTSPG